MAGGEVLENPIYAATQDPGRSSAARHERRLLPEHEHAEGAVLRTPGTPPATAGNVAKNRKVVGNLRAAAAEAVPETDPKTREPGAAPEAFDGEKRTTA